MAAFENDLYELLGVPINATTEEIHENYLKLIEDLKPDESLEDQAKLSELSAAHKILTDEQKRSRYDEGGIQAAHYSDSDSEQDLFEMFSSGMGGLGGGHPFAQLFGDGPFGGHMRGGPRRGKDSLGRLPVTLEQLYNGYTKELELEKSIICPACNGLGGKDGASFTCRSCRGHGIKVTMRQIGPGMMQQMRGPCQDCNGRGDIMAEEDRCPECKGQKTLQKENKLKVEVEPGMMSGTKITFEGESDQEPDVEPGDVIIQLIEQPHERFKRDACDLHVTHVIPITEALCGGKFVIKHLDDRELMVKMPKGQPVTNGDIRLVRGEGMPIRGRPGVKGNLFIKLKIEFPANNFTSEENLKKLEKVLGGRSRIVKVPTGDDVEEVNMDDYEAEHDGGAAGGDESDEEGHGPQMQCAHQ